MKRSTLKRTPFLKKKSVKKETKGLFDYLKKETKDEEWRRIKEEITPFFVSTGLYNICELKLSKCMGNFKLSFAHSKKREDWANTLPQRDIDAKEVVRACPNCHDEIEYPEVDKTKGELGREIMYNIVVQTIKRREDALKRWKTKS